MRTWRDGFRRESSCGTKGSLGRPTDGRLPLTTANDSSQPVLQRVCKNYSAVHFQACQGPMHDTLQRLLPFHSSRLLSSFSLSITPLSVQDDFINDRKSRNFGTGSHPQSSSSHPFVRTPFYPMTRRVPRAAVLSVTPPQRHCSLRDVPRSTPPPQTQ